jgi:hypothetical protein
MAKRKKKDPAAVALGRKGGKRTAKLRTAQERSEAARRAINARWDAERARAQKEGTL